MRHKKTIRSPKVVGWGTLWGRHLVGFLLSGTQGKPPMELIGAVVGMSQTKTCVCTCNVPSFIVGWSVCVFYAGFILFFLNLDPLGMCPLLRKFQQPAPSPAISSFHAPHSSVATSCVGTTAPVTTEEPLVSGPCSLLTGPWWWIEHGE